MLSKTRVKNIEHLLWLAGNITTTLEIKHKMNEYIDLYRYSKISNIKTVVNEINKLSSTNKKIQDKAIQKYETTIEQKRNTPPLKERMSTARIDNVGKKIDANNRRLIEELPRQRTAMKIQRLFKNGIAYEVSKKPNTLKNALLMNLCKK